MDHVTIPEAAQRLGVSEVTIRRRIKRGELAAEKIETGSGFAYRILLPPVEETGREAGQPPASESTVLESALATLREELERRSEENRRLQELLAREQEMVRRLIEHVPALPEMATTQETRQSAVDAEPSLGWWSRLRKRLITG